MIEVETKLGFDEFEEYRTKLASILPFFAFES